MNKNESKKRALTGKVICLVEDDDQLLEQLTHEFIEKGATNVEKVQTVEEGRYLLEDGGTRFDLIVVDVMLPRTREDYNKIQQWKEELKAYRDTIIQNEEEGPDNDDFKRRLELARERRPLIINNINDLIDKEGGLNMIVDWNNHIEQENIKIHDSAKKLKRPPVLYLTALGDEKTMDRGKRIAGPNSYWLVKPVFIERIVNEAIKATKSIHRIEIQ